MSHSVRNDAVDIGGCTMYMFGGGPSVGSKSHKRVKFRSCSGGDLSITVQPILKKFTVLETAIQGLHFHFCSLLDIFAP